MANSIKITNVAEEIVLRDTATGTRREMTIADAKADGFRNFKYVLDAAGNFVTSDGSAVTENTDKVMVVVRESVIPTDRAVQFYRTQQKKVLIKGDELTIEYKDEAEKAFYEQYANINGLKVEEA